MTYQPDFSGIGAKLDRAEQHRKTLEGEVGLVCSSDGSYVPAITNRIPIRLQFDPESGDHVFRATAVPSEDAIRRWGVIIGDAVHSLRSALDHLVWQLACYKTGGASLPGVPEEEARNVQFPITDSPPKGVSPQDFKATGALKHVLPAHRAIIYEHQPYGSSFDFSYGAIHPLLNLQRLSNDDKHRVITPVLMLPNQFSAPEAIFGGIGGEIVEFKGPGTVFFGTPEGGTTQMLPWDPAGRLLKPDAEIVRVKVRPASLQIDMEVAGYFAPTVSFRDTLPNGSAYVRSAGIELGNIHFQVLEVVREFHELSY